VKFVVSDLAGTLTTGSPVLGLVDWVRHHQSRLHANLYTASVIPSYFLAKKGLIDWGKWTRRLMLSSLPLIKDATEGKIRDMAEWSVEHELWPKRRTDVLSRLARHREDGASLYIASSAFEPTAVAFARRVGSQGIGSTIKVEDGRACFGTTIAAAEQKVVMVMDRLGVDRLDCAYGDTKADIPLLELADHPVAVYPDEVLRATAVERGWEILGDRNGI
jgi:phosphoserine phosphatase